MKKTYITPEVEAIEVQIEAIIALSTQGDQITDGNKDDFEPLGREDHTPFRPGIWEQGW